jgi:hypothetical protein
MGRPTDYREEFCEEARKLCENGATDVEVADGLEISVATLYRWKGKFPQFCEALKAGKSIADERVERSLYHKAIGYTFDSEKVFQFQGSIVRAATREHVPPDTTAAIFWLKNRRAEQWRDKTEVHHKHSVEHMSDHDLERIAAGRSEGAAEAPIDPKELN